MGFLQIPRADVTHDFLFIGGLLGAYLHLYVYCQVILA